MTGFFVSQNQTYKIEHQKQILWSPKKNKTGGNNKGYVNMSKVKKGDIIFHYHHKRITHVSIALVNAYDCIRPSEFKNNKWGHLGWQVNLSMYEVSLNTEKFISYSKKEKNDEIFNKNGNVNQMYLFKLTNNQLNYLMNCVNEEIKEHLQKDVKNSLLPSVTIINSTQKPTPLDHYSPRDSNYLKINALKFKIGKLGEEFILDYLTKKYPKPNFDIIPLSENLNSLSGNDSAGYDIKILNKETNDAVLIDVKSTTSTATPPFFMSQNEYKVFKESLTKPNTSYYIYRLSNLNEVDKTYNLEIIGPEQLSHAIFTPNAYIVSI